MNFGLVAAGLAVASILDWRSRRVPNWFTIPLALVGIIFQTWTYGTTGLFQALLGFGCGMLLLFIPFVLGGTGGGDVKLLAAVGAFVGPTGVFQIFFASALFGGVFSFIEILRRKAVRETFQRIRERLLCFVLSGRPVSESEVSFSSNPIRVPYAAMIGLGYVWFCFFRGGG